MNVGELRQLVIVMLLLLVEPESKGVMNLKKPYEVNVRKILGQLGVVIW